MKKISNRKRWTAAEIGIIALCRRKFGGHYVQQAVEVLREVGFPGRTHSSITSCFSNAISSGDAPINMLWQIAIGSKHYIGDNFNINLSLYDGDMLKVLNKYGLLSGKIYRPNV